MRKRNIAQKLILQEIISTSAFLTDLLFISHLTLFSFCKYSLFTKKQGAGGCELFPKIDKRTSSYYRPTVFYFKVL